MVICNENYSRLQLSPPHFYLSTALFSIVVGFFVVKYNSFIYGGSNNIRRLKSINRVNFSLASLRNLLPSLPPPFDRGNVAALGRDATEGIRRKSVRRKSVLRPRSSPRRRCRYRFPSGYSGPASFSRTYIRYMSPSIKALAVAPFRQQFPTSSSNSNSNNQKNLHQI